MIRVSLNFILMRVVKGFQEFKKAKKFWMNPDFKAIRYEIKYLSINFSNSGDVAWFFCMLDDVNEWRREPAIGKPHAGVQF